MGWQVFLAARDIDRGTTAVRELTRAGLRAEFVPMDVTSDESVEKALDLVTTRTRQLDVLVNNAGVGGPSTPPAETPADDLGAVFETNVLGAVRVTNAFLPLLRASPNPRIVMVSSGMGSIATMTDPALAGLVRPTLGYPASKAALNMITSQYARALPDIRINAVDPGYTATDLTGHTGFQTVTEGTDAIVDLAGIESTGPTGGFFDRNGRTPW
ncbi:short-chain dehydrogenase [Nocardia jinanensis]|uniref:Short-chain dehydrogenase n=2 Tax=Nocardia jinanensis TaxID=382504 RepID=A0A917RJJ5_9NOCA|nr:short-chain dehydrogenase [Nocardia jinanensis]